MMYIIILTASSLKLKRMPTSKIDFVTSMWMEGKPDIILTAWDTAQVMTYFGQFKAANINYRMSHSLGHLEMGSIVCRTWPQAIPMFLHFTCFTSDVWIAIFTSILSISIALSLKIKSISAFYEYFWNLLIIIFTPCFQKFILNSNSIRFLAGIWLISSLVISTQFTSFLLDYMARPNPIIKIDSLQDLADRPGLKVFASDDSTLVAYATEEVNDPLAIAIREKIVEFSAEAILDRKFRLDLIDKLRAGTHCYSFHRMLILFQVIRLMNEEPLRDNGDKLGDILHLSAESAGHLPSALGVSEDQEFINHGIDQM